LDICAGLCGKTGTVDLGRVTLSFVTGSLHGSQIG
jgi:hypothetical protein